MRRARTIFRCFSILFILCHVILAASSQIDRTQPILIDHTCTRLEKIPSEWILKAKQNLRIAYGFTSHGSQLVTGMTGLYQWKGAEYAWKARGGSGALDLRDFRGNFGNLGIANDLGNPDRTSWEKATRTYLEKNPDINVIVWAWCWQVDGTEADIKLYLDLMDKLERDYPRVLFVYMTGPLNGAPLTGPRGRINVPRRNVQIRDYCRTNKKVLYDFADIESYDPDGNYYGDKLANDACDFDSDGDGIRDRNWAKDWQSAHPGEWYDCPAAHSQPLNANRKAYAAWWLWARLAGWNGRTS